MRYRIVLALLALGGLTAFAPAPFVEKKKPAPTAGLLEGVWERVSFNGGKLPAPGGQRMFIRVEMGKWTFESENNPKGPPRRKVVYFLKLDRTASPPVFELRRQETDPEAYGRGTFEVKGNELSISYSFGYRGRASAAPREFRMSLRRVSK